MAVAWKPLLIAFLSACPAVRPAEPAARFAPANEEWNRPVEPFRIAGNIFYVGASGVSAFLITTPEGHILLDAGFAETAPLVESGVRKLGFRLEDVRILLASHGHYDHAGGLAQMKRRTHARLLVNPAEAGLLSGGGKGDFAFGDRYAFPPVAAGALLADGGEIRLGGTVVTAHFTPGHTKGSTTYTTSVRDGERILRVVFAASLTAPGYRLVDNPGYPGIVGDFESTFAKLRALPCDVFLAGHTWDFDLPAKLKARANGEGANPFIDPAGYRRWLDNSESVFRKQLAEQR